MGLADSTSYLNEANTTSECSKLCNIGNRHYLGHRGAKIKYLCQITQHYFF